MRASPSKEVPPATTLLYGETLALTYTFTYLGRAAMDEQALPVHGQGEQLTCRSRVASCFRP